MYMGAAHGVVGILNTLLSVSPEELRALEDVCSARSLIWQTIDQLDNLCLPSGNLESSIKTTMGTRSDRLVQ
jgi:hypothetical protein